MSMHQAKRQFLSKQLLEGFDFFEGGQEEGVSMRKAKAAKLEYPDYSVAIDTIDMHRHVLHCWKALVETVL